MRCSCGRSAGSFLQHERRLRGACEEDGIRFAGALAAFRNHDSAFAQDFDRRKDYHRDWNGVVPRQAPLSTGSGNVTLSCQQQHHDLVTITHAMLKSTQINFRTEGPSLNMRIWVWEQGLINVLHANGPVWATPERALPRPQARRPARWHAWLRLWTEPVRIRCCPFCRRLAARPTDLMTWRSLRPFSASARS